MPQILTIILILAAILLALTVAAGLIAGHIFYRLALVPGTDRSSVLGAGHNAMPHEESEASRLRRARNKAWYEGTAIAHEAITSYDGLTLKAQAARQGSGLWAILCHGYTCDSSQSIGFARQFYARGYNVLMPDARGHGESGGGYIGMGWHDRRDITAWVGQILEWDSNAQIVLYGVSMGGATVMMAAGEDLPPNVKAIVEDCGYTSVWDEFSYQLKATFNLPSFPVMHFSSLITKLRAGYWLGEASALAQVAKSHTPILFIHGDADTFVPASMVYKVYEAAPVEKLLLIAKGAGHGGAAATLGDEYWSTVFEFVSHYIT